jgi:hypothetical protein
MEDYKLGFNTSTDNYKYKTDTGLSENVVREISHQKMSQSGCLK